MTKRTVVHAMFTVERTYDATPARVFEAFSDTAAKRRWFAEGDGWTIDEFAADFRPGGIELSRFRYRDGPPMRNDTVYQDIVPNERIIIAYSMMIGDDRISSSLATMEFRPAGGGTRLILTEQGAYLDGHDDVPQREEGTRGLLEALDKELKRKRA